MKRIAMLAVLTAMTTTVCAQPKTSTQPTTTTQAQLRTSQELRDLSAEYEAFAAISRYEKEEKAKRVQAYPTNESYWLSYYHAAYTLRLIDANDSTMYEVFKQMKEAIPDTYAYHVCATLVLSADHQTLAAHADEARFHASEAIRLMPEEMGESNTFTGLMASMMKLGDEKRFTDLAKVWRLEGWFQHDNIFFSYAYNELQGMDDGGVFIKDDEDIMHWTQQYVLGAHHGKLILTTRFLPYTGYRQMVYDKLGMAPVPEDPAQGEDLDDYTERILRDIIERSGHPIYFAITNKERTYRPWQQNLYNEGMVLKYAKKPYDNMAVKRRNVEEHYQMDYLENTALRGWGEGGNDSANYIIMLADLLPYYKQHNPPLYRRLRRQLEAALEIATVTDENHEILKNMIK